MYILCTTSRAFLLLDTSSGQYEVLDEGRGLYYGIAYSDEEIFVVARGQPVTTEIERQLEDGTILVFGFDKRYRRAIKAPFFLRDMHQILYHDGRLWILCSFDNMIAVYDGRNWEIWYPNPEERTSDANHFNSIYIKKDRCYVAAHNWDRPSRILVFSYPGRDLLDILEMGSQIHNIWIDDDRCYTCSSKDETVINQSGFELFAGGYTRGIAVTAEYIFLGVSEMAERHERNYTSGSIIVFDRSWRFLRRIQLNQLGLVLEIRVPGDPDICYPGHLGHALTPDRETLLTRLFGRKTRPRFPVLTSSTPGFESPGGIGADPCSVDVIDDG